MKTVDSNPHTSHQAHRTNRLRLRRNDLFRLADWTEMISRSPIPTVILDLEGKVLTANDSLAEVLGAASAEHLEDAELLAHIDELPSQDAIAAILRDPLLGGVVETTARRFDGSAVEVLFSYRVRTDATGTPTEIFCQLRQSVAGGGEHATANTEDGFDAIDAIDAIHSGALSAAGRAEEADNASPGGTGHVTSAADGTVIVDPSGRMLLCDRVAERLLGIAGGVQANSHFDHPFNAGHHYELDLPDTSGRLRTIAIASAAIDWLGQPAFLISIHEQAAVPLVGDASADPRRLHDSLTGLPGRELFLNEVYDEIRKLGRHGDDTPCAVLRIDLLHFSGINAEHGSTVGDEVLRIVADRLSGSIRNGDHLARLGDDDFALLLPGAAFSDHVLVAERITAVLQEPMDIDGITIHFSPVVGIAQHRLGQNEQQLLDEAEFTAVEHRDHTERTPARPLLPEPVAAPKPTAAPTPAERASRLATALTSAIDEGQLFLNYQPIFDLSNTTIVGIEALARWLHPEDGLIAPNDFVQIAVETGQSSTLGAWVLDEAADQVVAWRKRYPDHLIPPMSINVTAREILDDNFRRNALTGLTRRGLRPSMFHFEVKEQALLNLGAAQVRQRLIQLAADGFVIDLDDFGAGVSSLTNLQQVPLTSLKIHRSCISRMVEDEPTARLVSATIAAALALDLNVIAVGVETAEEKSMLYRYGCQQAQGYLLARPLKPIEAARFFVRDPSTTATRSRNEGLLRRGTTS